MPMNYVHSVQLNVYFKFVLLVPACSKPLAECNYMSTRLSGSPKPPPQQAIKQRKKHGYNHCGEVRATHNHMEGTL